jgi:hypothetical protein
MAYRLAHTGRNHLTDIHLLRFDSRVHANIPNIDRWNLLSTKEFLRAGGVLTLI